MMAWLALVHRRRILWISDVLQRPKEAAAELRAQAQDALVNVVQG